MRRVLEAVRGAHERRVRPRLTAEGVWFGLILLGVVLAAVNTGNNLLYMVLGGLCACLLVSNVLAEWNLRGLSVERRLPPELFAGRAAVGAYRVTNHRPFGASRLVWVTEGDGTGGEALAIEVKARSSVEVPTTWTLPVRGEYELERIRLSSRFPFGLVERSRSLPAPAKVLVFPAPVPGPPAPAAPDLGVPQRELRHAGSGDEFWGLRAYVPGDPMRNVHWGTSARAGKPMVVERHAQGALEVLVRVPTLRGPALEREIGIATGQALRHFQAGHAVGLELGDRRHPPRQGEAWRRQVLVLLALCPPEPA